MSPQSEDSYFICTSPGLQEQLARGKPQKNPLRNQKKKVAQKETEVKVTDNGNSERERAREREKGNKSRSKQKHIC